MILDTTTKSIEVLLGGMVTTNQLPITVAFADHTSVTFAPGSTDTQTNNTTAVTAVASPAANIQRQVKSIIIFEADTVTATVTVRLNDNGTSRILIKRTLQPNDTLQWTYENGWVVVAGAPGYQSGSRVQGLVGANNAITPNTKYDLQADLIVAFDRTTKATYIKEGQSSTTCDLGATGANGLDAGTQAASTWYHFYWIYNPTTNTWATIASTTAPPTGPSLPSGYTAWAYATAIYSNSGTALLVTWINGARCELKFRINLLVSGAATVETAITATVPGNALSVFGLARITESNNTSVGLQSTAFLYAISGGNTLATARAQVLNVNLDVDFQWEENIRSQTIYYKVGPSANSTTTLTVDETGYTLPNGDS